MMQTFDPARFEAFTRLLERPDPGDLPRRAHAFRYDGDPNRRATRFPEIFMGWLQQRHLDADPPDQATSATRTTTWRDRRAILRLRVLRPTGTG